MVRICTAEFVNKIAKETHDIQYTRNTQGFNVSIDTVQAVVHDERVVDCINAIESKATQDRNSVTAKEHNIYLGYVASIIALKGEENPKSRFSISIFDSLGVCMMHVHSYKHAALYWYRKFKIL